MVPTVYSTTVTRFQPAGSHFTKMRAPELWDLGTLLSVTQR